MRLRSADPNATAAALQTAGLLVVMLGAFAILALSMVHTGPSVTARAPVPERPAAMP